MPLPQWFHIVWRQGQAGTVADGHSLVRACKCRGDWKARQPLTQPSTTLSMNRSAEHPLDPLENWLATGRAGARRSIPMPVPGLNARNWSRGNLSPSDAERDGVRGGDWIFGYRPGGFVSPTTEG